MNLPINKGNYSIEKIIKLLEQGYGKGEGKDYKPYIDVIKVASKGRATRVKGWKTNRVHHFLSDSETRFFYLMEYQDSVVDIREHYPLIDDVEELFNVLDDQLINRLFNQKTGEPLVLTTSFLITEKNSSGEIKYIARSIKDYKQLDNMRTIERFEVMRRYWELKGIDYGIITNKEIPIVFAKNIEYVHSFYHLEDYGFNLNEQLFYEDYLIKLIRDNQYKSIKEVLFCFDKKFEFEDGTGLLFFKHLLARKIVKVNMNKAINLEESCSTVNILVKKEGLDAFYQYVDSI